MDYREIDIASMSGRMLRLDPIAGDTAGHRQIRRCKLLQTAEHGSWLLEEAWKYPLTCCWPRNEQIALKLAEHRIASGRVVVAQCCRRPVSFEHDDDYGPAVPTFVSQIHSAMARAAEHFAAEGRVDWLRWKQEEQSRCRDERLSYWLTGIGTAMSSTWS